MNDLLYVIPANSKKEDIIATLKQHPEIKFVSLVGIDLAGNDTDEKIPMRVFLEDIDSFYNGSAVQTDGSSVVLTGIATLNNAKVDIANCLCEKYIKNKDTAYKKEIIKLYDNIGLKWEKYEKPNINADTICKYRGQIFIQAFDL